jgi:hypothetical protein
MVRPFKKTDNDISSGAIYSKPSLYKYDKVSNMMFLISNDATSSKTDLKDPRTE